MQHGRISGRNSGRDPVDAGVDRLQHAALPQGDVDRVRPVRIERDVEHGERRQAVVERGPGDPGIVRSKDAGEVDAGPDSSFDHRVHLDGREDRERGQALSRKKPRRPAVHRPEDAAPVHARVDAQGIRGVDRDVRDAAAVGPERDPGRRLRERRRGEEDERKKQPDGAGHHGEESMHGAGRKAGCGDEWGDWRDGFQ